MKRLLIAAALLLMACASNPTTNDMGYINFQFASSYNDVEATFSILDLGGNVVDIFTTTGSYEEYTASVPFGTYQVCAVFSKLEWQEENVICIIQTENDVFDFSLWLDNNEPSGSTGLFLVEVY